MNELSVEAVGLEELCEITLIPAQIIYTIVEFGIVEPQGQSPDNWRFDNHQIAITRKALRLHQDLEIDWAGIALAISLIEELEQLRDANRVLRHRLKHFG